MAQRNDENFEDKRGWQPLALIGVDCPPHKFLKAFLKPLSLPRHNVRCDFRLSNTSLLERDLFNIY